MNFFKSVVFCCLLGACFYAYQNNWFIICLPVTKPSGEQNAQASSKKVMLIWWQAGQWKQESVDIMWPGDMSSALWTLLQKWLQVTGEEKNEHNDTLLQSVVLSSNKKIIYISCTRNPFDRNACMHDKLLWIESLCRTLSQNGITATHIQFLVKHTVLQDPHLDFSQPWPIAGFD